MNEREITLLARLILVPEFGFCGTMGILARGLTDARLLDAKGVSPGNHTSRDEADARPSEKGVSLISINNNNADC